MTLTRWLVMLACASCLKGQTLKAFEADKCLVVEHTRDGAKDSLRVSAGEKCEVSSGR